MSTKISDTLKKTWASLIDERLNIGMLIFALLITTALAFFTVHIYSAEGFTSTSLVAIFAPATGLMLFVIKNIHDRNVELKKKDDLALFYLTYLFQRHNLKTLKNFISIYVDEINESLQEDIEAIPRSDRDQHIRNINAKVEGSIYGLITAIERFNPPYFEGNSGACFNIQQQIGVTLLDLLETLESLRENIRIYDEQENEYQQKLIAGMAKNNTRFVHKVLGINCTSSNMI